MKHISILVPKGQYSIVNIAGAHQILNWANEWFIQQTRKPLFKIDFVGYAKPAKDELGIYSVTAPKSIEEIPKTDLIIVPAVHSPHSEAIQQNKLAIQWITNQYQNGSEIAAFCIGVFLLAETGLLDGKSCSTHWGEALALQRMYPKIKVKPEHIVTESQGIYTSGGAYAFTNLVIYLIEKYGGRELAIATAKAFMIDIDKGSQSAFMMFRGQKDHKDDMVLKVQQFIEEHFVQKFTVADLAAQHTTNRRSLERRFKQATGNSILEYMQRVRTEAAKKLLEQGRKPIGEVMYAIGYNDPKAFRTVFKKYVGLSPNAYRNKYHSH